MGWRGRNRNVRPRDAANFKTAAHLQLPGGAPGELRPLRSFAIERVSVDFSSRSAPSSTTRTAESPLIQFCVTRRPANLEPRGQQRRRLLLVLIARNSDPAARSAHGGEATTKKAQLQRAAHQTSDRRVYAAARTFPHQTLQTVFLLLSIRTEVCRSESGSDSRG